MLKIAVPTRGGMVDEHFGHCEAFTIFTVNDDKTVASQEQFTPPPSCGCKSGVINTLAEMGVTALVAGNMGEGAVVRLMQGGIKVVRGASGPVSEAVRAFLDGSLIDTQVLCASHECHDH